MEIRVFTMERNVTTLGPGSRFALWVQGCSRRCPGCVSPETQPFDGGTVMTAAQLALEIRMAGTDGLTISGGEPFLQAEALSEMIGLVRKHTDIGVIIYTGYTLEELEQMQEAQNLLADTDLLIDGPYVQQLDDGKSLRGSSNQRVIPLTARYVNALDLYGTDVREVQKVCRGFTVKLIGVPDKRDKNRK